MANWRRIIKLRKFLETVPPQRLKMNKLLVIDREQETIKEALEPSCGTVGCIAGWAHLLFAPRKSTYLKIGTPECADSLSNVDGADGEFAAEYLALSLNESDHVFMGRWAGKELEDITKKDILRYLDKAIEARDLLVNIYK